MARSNLPMAAVMAGIGLFVSASLYDADASVVFTVNTVSGSGAPDPSSWLATVDQVSVFDTTSANLVAASEISAAPGSNEFGLGGSSATLTFDSTVTGLPWSFALAAPASAVTPDVATGFTFNDTEGDSRFRADTLSVGDVNNHENDDVVFTFTGGPDLHGFGFELVDNLSSGSNETISVFGAGDALLGTLTLPAASAGNGEQYFIGISSSDPILRIEFDEDASGDDVGVRDFRFAALSVPEPSAGIFFIAGAALLMFRRRRDSTN